MAHKIALTIKPTMSCNMYCKHCFNGESINNPKILPIETACRFIEITARDYDDIKVTFHGGEPSLAGYEYYKTFYEYQKKIAKIYGVSFANSFTTNGLLLNDKFINLFISNNVQVNLSFDGPYNDVLRNNTDKVYSNICQLQNKGVNLHIFCTIAKEGSDDLVNIYKWFRDRKLNFKMLPIEPRGFARKKQDMLLDTDTFIKSLSKAYRLWLKDKATAMHMYTFQQFATARRDSQYKPYWFNREVALNPDGKIYPFGRPNDVDFYLGNPEKVEHLDDCFDCSEYNRMRNILQNLFMKRCEICPSFNTCHGVSLFMSYMYASDEYTLNSACEKTNAIFQEVLRINDEVIDEFQKGDFCQYNDYVIKVFQDYIST